MELFGTTSNFEKRFIANYDQLAATVDLMRRSGLRIVLTSGSFDMIHIGHALYLEHARSLGDVLIVGVDSDEKLRQRKGPDRPIVPQDERLHTLTHLRSVDIVTLKTPEHPHWHLLSTVRPDVLVVSKSTKQRSEEEMAGLRELCGEVVELEPQATGGTSARIRLLHITGARKLTEIFVRLMPDFVQAALAEFQDGRRLPDGKGDVS